VKTVAGASPIQSQSGVAPPMRAFATIALSSSLRGVLLEEARERRAALGGTLRDVDRRAARSSYR
jgi:hypothetical protein